MAPTSPPGETTLRTLMLWTWLPAFILLVSISIHAPSIPLFLSFIPLSLSLFTGVTYRLIINRRSCIHSADEIQLMSRNRRVAKSLCSLAWPILDFSIFGLYLGLLVPIWVNRYDLTWDANAMMLEAYATCVPIANMAIHFYLVSYPSLVFLQSALEKPSSTHVTCPNCGHAATTTVVGVSAQPPMMTTKRTDRSALYSLLGERNFSDFDLPEGEEERGIVREEVEGKGRVSEEGGPSKNGGIAEL